MANFLIQEQITWDSSSPISSIIELARDLMVIYILTKFGADWLIFVDASVNKKIVEGWTDRRLDGQRRTVSDHNSSLSTPCSGELKKRQTSVLVSHLLGHLQMFLCLVQTIVEWYPNTGFFLTARKYYNYLPYVEVISCQTFPKVKTLGEVMKACSLIGWPL